MSEAHDTDAKPSPITVGVDGETVTLHMGAFACEMHAVQVWLLTQVLLRATNEAMHAHARTLKPKLCKLCLAMGYRCPQCMTKELSQLLGKVRRTMTPPGEETVH